MRWLREGQAKAQREATEGGEAEEQNGEGLRGWGRMTYWTWKN